MRRHETGNRKPETGNRQKGRRGSARRSWPPSARIAEPSAGFRFPVSGLPSDSRGFVLASSVLIILLLGSLLALVHLLVQSQWRNVQQVESQMHSRILAENGLEYARSLLPLLQVDALLPGLDPKRCGGGAQWRNPMPLDEARRIDPARFQPPCDDGLPHLKGAPLPSYRLDGRGGFWIRYSNDPEEDPFSDLDGVIVVRSLGIAPSRAPHPSFPSAVNSVSLLEARLRQETSFLLSQPLTVFADSALFVWEGEDFGIDGGDQAAFGGASLLGTRLWQDLLTSLTPSQSLRLQGGGLTPSLRDIRLDWLASATRRRFFSALFWEGLTRNLPEFDQGLAGSLALLEDPGAVVIDFRGILFCRGDLELSGASRISGLLVHLGGGRLTLRDNASVEGAVWLSNLQSSGGGGLKAGPVSFRMTRRASILYDEEAIQTAVAALPPTQLGWRIIFPETIP